MKIETSILSRKLEAIQDTFQQAFTIAAETPVLSALAPKLDAFNAEVRSVAYEGASMHIALSALEVNAELSDWFEFLEGPAALHTTLFHIGLGWALAQLQQDALPYLPLLDIINRYRVLDGYGYYEAIFRSKKVIHNQLGLKYSDTAALSAYHQGIGRGIWYSTGGDIESAQNLIENFPVERHANLWRGIGIACAYAGGNDETRLKEVMALAGDYRRQLATAAVMVAITRNTAGFMSADTELACRVWCKQTSAELVTHHKFTGVTEDANAAIVYLNWISGIESSF